MMMTSFSEQIKSIDLPALMEAEDIRLRPDGSKFRGLCMAHDDHHPSMSVYADNHFKCWACGVYGDAVDFIQIKYGCSFKEALRYLGITTQPMTNELRRKITDAKRRRILEEKLQQRERDIVHTLSILIRAAHKCSEFVHLLPAWEWYHQMICTGTKEEKAAIIEGLKNWPTLRRCPLFKPRFDYRKWLQGFLQ